MYVISSSILTFMQYICSISTCGVLKCVRVLGVPSVSSCGHVDFSCGMALAINAEACLNFNVQPPALARPRNI